MFNLINKMASLFSLKKKININNFLLLEYSLRVLQLLVRGSNPHSTSCCDAAQRQPPKLVSTLPSKLPLEKKRFSFRCVIFFKIVELAFAKNLVSDLINHSLLTAFALIRSALMRLISFNCFLYWSG